MCWAVLLLTAASAGGEEPDFLTRGRKRQERVRSFAVRFEVHEKRTVTLAVKSQARPNTVTAIRELTSENRVVSRGDCVRYECNHSALELPRGVLHPTPQLIVTDGTVMRTLWPRGVTPGRGVEADIQPAPKTLGTGLLDPIWATVRMLDLPASGGVRDAKPADEILVIGGVPCRRFDSPGGRSSLWVDDAGLIRRRIRWSPAGKVTSRFDAEFGQTEAGVSFPMSWEYQTYLPSGSLHSAYTVTVQEVEVNVEPAPGEFQLEFPPGSHLNDKARNKRFRVEDGGTLVEIDPGTGAPLVAAPVAPAGRERIMTLTVVGAALLLVSVVVLLTAAWRMRAARAT